MIQRVLVSAAIIIAALMFLASLAGGWQVAQALLFGWYWFLERVSSRITPNPARIVSATILCVLVFGGLQWFLGWIYSHSRAEEGPRRWRLRWTASLLLLFCLLFVTGLAVTGVVHQVGWLLTSAEPHYRRYPLVMPSSMNLAAIGLAVHGSVSADEQVPLATLRNKRGEPVHGWQSKILPWLIYRYDEIDWDQPWNSARNAPFFKLLIPEYLSPDVPLVRDSEAFGLSHYAGNSAIFRNDKPLDWKALEPRASQVMLAGEIAGEFPAWGKPGNVRDLSVGLNQSPRGFGNLRGEGAYFVFADGSVRFVRNGADSGILRAMSGASDSKSTLGR